MVIFSTIYIFYLGLFVLFWTFMPVCVKSIKPQIRRIEKIFYGENCNENDNCKSVRPRSDLWGRIGLRGGQRWSVVEVARSIHHSSFSLTVGNLAGQWTKRLSCGSVGGHNTSRPNLVLTGWGTCTVDFMCKGPQSGSVLLRQC